MYRSNRHVPLARGAIVVATLLLSGLLTVAMPGSAAAGVTVTPNVPKLPAGALPHLPYVNWAAKQIVDGNRKVSIAGLQRNVHSLHKVDGGYLLLRADFTNWNWDLVFVSTAGARRVLVAHVFPPTYPTLRDGNMLAVSSGGDKVVVDTATGGGWGTSYLDTRVISLPAGQVLQKKKFDGQRPHLLAYGIDRVLLTTHEPKFYADTKWWTPATGAVTDIRDDTAGEAADLSAWQWAVRPQVGDFTRAGHPAGHRTRLACGGGFSRVRALFRYMVTRRQEDRGPQRVERRQRGGGQRLHRPPRFRRRPSAQRLGQPGRPDRVGDRAPRC